MSTPDQQEAVRPHRFARKTREDCSAPSPFALPLVAWRRAIFRTAGQIGDDNLALVAGGCAFFTLLSLFPAMTAIISLYGLIAEPQQVFRDLSFLADIAPGDAMSLLQRQTQNLTDSSTSGLGVSFAVSLAISLWGASRTTRSMMGALNIVYGEKEKRGFVRLNFQIVGTTIIGIAAVTLLLLTITAMPIIVGAIFDEQYAQRLAIVLTWCVVAVAMVTTLMLLYRFGPSRANAQWLWVLPGALIGVVTWVIASLVFSVYVSQIANFSGVYGAFGTLVVLLMWIYWSFLVVLLGAELNAELEHEVSPDTTTGHPQPLGDRQAKMADRLAR
ncbi:YihY/virulence factor BrkB family protein [Parvularcula sp. LCG005]|uniref:YihY/virulence factor BrkB family protein n=1 Tax=Parvularcula sp. LCG005 TaxID=3078805 RepID=UPI002943064B|nr:YihY/virulence factor BrkB family protein [Parvularcula sp. LCG005]WOI54062.1 YihY/virulence factor BrkB family protein [Parvularcula sp. LCG005]